MIRIYGRFCGKDIILRVIAKDCGKVWQVATCWAVSFPVWCTEESMKIDDGKAIKALNARCTALDYKIAEMQREYRELCRTAELAELAFAEKYGEVYDEGKVE